MKMYFLNDKKTVLPPVSKHSTIQCVTTTHTCTNTLKNSIVVRNIKLVVCSMKVQLPHCLIKYGR